LGSISAQLLVAVARRVAIVSATTTDIVKNHRDDEVIRHERIDSHPGT